MEEISKSQHFRAPERLIWIYHMVQLNKETEEP